MDSVFITHSRHDAPILEHIAQLIKLANVSPIFYEYDSNSATTAWEEIRNAIRKCRALFVVLSNNLSSSPHTQNWVGFEVGVACSFNKPVWVFEEIDRSVSFPIPYLTDYLPYNLNDPDLRELISSAARSYNMKPQQSSIIGLGGLGALLFGWQGLIGGAIIGAIANTPKLPPYLNLICYHPDCKTRFRSYVWLEQMECPACRRRLRFRTQPLQDGQQAILPSPYAYELVNDGYYVWYNERGDLEVYQLGLG